MSEVEEEIDHTQVIIGLVSQMWADSDFYITEKRKKKQDFSIEKEEDQLTPDKREIRWHKYVIDAIVLSVEEN